MDAAGVIDKLGPDTDERLSVGDQVVALVMPSGLRGGAYGDKIVLPAASVVPIPAGTGFPEAATLLMNAVTARLCLDALGLAPGKTLAVTGAAGAVGGYAMQLAKVCTSSPIRPPAMRNSSDRWVRTRSFTVAADLRKESGQLSRTESMV
jgi:NADPH:quinone reductase-like Zn-dependent oxidoreductase